MAHPILKQFGDLKPDDFRRHPIWVFVHIADYDEEWYDETDEETVRPWLGERPVGADDMFLVSARLRFADGTEVEGFVTPTTSDDGLSSLGSLNPQVFAQSGQRFAFWHGMFRQPEAEKLFYESFAKSPERVFPIEFQALPGLTSSVASGSIPGFMSVPRGEEVVVVTECTRSQERIFSVLPRWNLIVLAVPLMLVVAVLTLVVASIVTGQLEFLQRYGIPSGILLFILLSMLRPFLTLSHSIVVRSDSVVFRGLRRERVVRAGKAQALRPATSLQGTFEVCFEEGRATFFARFTGFHEVVLALKSQNPRMTIEKC